MSIEQKINYQLNKFPAVKKIIKRCYQKLFCAISHSVKAEGSIVRVSPADAKHEYFFGYYDKSPWDATDRYMLCMKARDTWSDVSPKEKAEILLIDTEKKENDAERVQVLAETYAWNVQQSCMLQWLGPDFSSRIIYNDYRDGKYVSVILTLATKEERIIPAPVYSVSEDGTFALTLDFSRLYELRPGYGYYNVPEQTKGIALPDATAIWTINLQTGNVKPLLTYKDFASFKPRMEMLEPGSVHKVNHIMLSPKGKRFMVLYRWFLGQRKYTRLITCNVDGTDMYVLSDDDMVSHCFWKNEREILAFENKREGGPGYYLMEDQSDQFIHCWPDISNDGHPSYNPDRTLIVTDSYPDRTRMAAITLMDGDETQKEINRVVRVFAPFKYDNDTRCDLHPRFNHAGDRICFDSVFEGHRGLYITDVSAYKNVIKAEGKKDDTAFPKYSIVTPLYNSFVLMDRYFDSLQKQTYRNFEIIIVDDCSTDGSFEKVKAYAEKSELKITVLRSEKNAGPGNARNIGMDAAKGQWITFVDNDDWVTSEFLENIERVIARKKVNCVVFDYMTTDGETSKNARTMYNGETGLKSIGECIKNVRNHTFGKVYNLACLREADIRYPELRRCEDVAFVCRAIDACDSVYYLHKALYYYFQRVSSLSNNTKLDQTDMIQAFTYLENYFGDRYQQELKEKSVSDLLYGVLLMMLKARKSRKEILEYLNEYEQKYPNWEQCQIVNHLGKAKKLFLLAAKQRNILALRTFSFLHSKLIG